LVIEYINKNTWNKKKMVLLCYDVIFYIGEFMLFRDRLAPISKRIVKYHLRRQSMSLHSWESKRLVFTYLKMFGPVQHTWLTWKRFGRKQLEISRRTRNFAGKLSWKESVVRKMTWGTCQGCGKPTQAVVFGTAICAICRALPFKTSCYMITTEKAVSKALRRGVPAQVVRKMPYHKMGQCRLRFNVDVNKALAKFELEKLK
jgi:hypothetical protein